MITMRVADGREVLLSGCESATGIKQFDKIRIPSTSETATALSVYYTGGICRAILSMDGTEERLDMPCSQLEKIADAATHAFIGDPFASF
jgi:hypothetical protein